MIIQQQEKTTTTQPFVSVGAYRYREADLLGSGYSSRVYKAIHAIKKFEVALKIIQLDKIQSGIHKNLLDSELRCLEALKGTPHVINLLDVVRTQRFLYVVTELCRGDLAVKDRKKVPQTQLWIYMKQLIKGYKSLHEKGIIHRDIKPENLLLKSEGQIKIGDFGFAATFTEVKQQVYYNIGSPSYMSPEVLYRNDYSSASDIWSIGVSYYELATGKLPWNGQTQEVITSQLNCPNIEKTIEKSGLSQVSKQFLLKTLCYQSYNRMKPQELFQFQFSRLPIAIKQKIVGKSFDQYSFTTAETPRQHSKTIYEPDASSKLYSSQTDFFDNIFQKPVQNKGRPDRHSRRMSLDTNLLQFSMRQQTTTPKPEEKPFYSEKIIGQQRQTAFKKKHRGSFDVVHQPKLQKDVPKIQVSPVERIVQRYLEVIKLIVKFLEEYQSINSIGKDAEQIHIFKICLKNYVIITVDKLNNLETTNLLEGTISQEQLKKYMQRNRTDSSVHQTRARLQANKQLAKHWVRAKQQKPKAISNAGTSIIKLAKKTLSTNSSKLPIQMIEKICDIVQIFNELSKNNDVMSQAITDQIKTNKNVGNWQTLLKKVDKIK